MGMRLLRGRHHARDPSRMAAGAEDDVGDRDCVLTGLEPAQAHAMIAAFADRPALAVDAPVPLAAAVAGRAYPIQIALGRAPRNVVERVGVGGPLAGDDGVVLAHPALSAPSLVPGLMAQN